jgi:hypothetical protein
MVSPSDHLHFGLLQGGYSYYVLARAGFRLQRMPEAGNLYHHALEYLMKAQLAHTHTAKELQDKFGHKLNRIWTAFKRDFPHQQQQLDALDRVVNEVHCFEQLRYPGKGMEITAEWERPPPRPRVKAQYDLPKYPLYVHDVDRLVAKLFEVMERDPKRVCGVLNPRARAAVEEHNPVANDLLP